MTVKTTSQGVLHSQIWSLSGGLWPGDGSSKKVRGEIGIHQTATISALVAQTGSTSTSFRPGRSPRGCSNVVLGL